ncbi:MAG: hypothetical protein JWO31_900 [Phycisphaerales bacterium]|nr:hypothetical protein [Phycisphaerales bacterium]
MLSALLRRASRRSIRPTSTSAEPAKRRGLAAVRSAVEGLEDRRLYSFTAPVAYPVGSSPHGMTTGDFNADGKADLVAANYGAAGTVSVLLGNGDGSFRPKIDFAAGPYAYDVAAGDFTGDGVADLAVSGSNGSLSVLAGVGDGTFGAPTTTAAGTGGHGLAVRDFDADGRADVAFANTTGTLSVLLGKGDGTFAAPTYLAAGVSPNAVVAGDFNKDGKPDLAAPNVLSGGTVTVLLGHGDGSFEPGQSYNAFSAPFAMDVGDFDHDGSDDIAVANSYTSSAVTVLIGNGDGTYKAPVSYQVPEAPFELEVEDFNGDGSPDIAEKGSNSFEVQLGRGDGSFYAPVIYATTPGPNGYAASDDFNGDGAADLVAPTNVGTVAVVTNANNDRANLATAVGFAVSMPPAVVAGANLPMTVSAVDADGNPVAGFVGTVYVDSNDPARKTEGFAYAFTTADAGTHTFTKTTTLSTVGTPTVTVSAPYMAPTTAQVTVTPLVTRLAVTTPAATTAGTPISFTVSAVDALGSVGAAYAGTVTFSSTDAQAGLPATYTFTAADAGTHTFTVTPKTAGNVYLAVRDAAFLSGGQYVSVAPAAVTTLTVVGGAGAVGVARPVTVAARDAYGNVVSGYANTVHFTSSDPLAVLPADTALVNGSAVVPVTLKTVGAQTITATDVTDPSLFGVDLGVEAAPAVAAYFNVTGLSATTAGASQTFTVTVIDTLGRPATNYGGTVYFGSSDYQAALPAGYTFTSADAGVHAFAGVLKTAGSQWVRATDGSTGVTGAEVGIDVSAAAATSLSVGGFPYAIAGDAKTFTVTARDAYGNVAPTYAGTVHFTSSDTLATLPADYAFAPADAGTHQFLATMRTANGQNTLSATDAAAASITGTQSNVNVNWAAASQFQFQTPSSITSGSAFTLKVRVLDAFGNTVKDYSGKVHFASTAASAVLPTDFTFSDADTGVHSFDVTVTSTGIQTLTLADLANAGLKSSLSVTVGSASGGGGGSGGGGKTTVSPPPVVSPPPPVTVPPVSPPTSGGKSGGGGGKKA